MDLDRFQLLGNMLIYNSNRHKHKAGIWAASNMLPRNQHKNKTWIWAEIAFCKCALMISTKTKHGFAPKSTCTMPDDPWIRFDALMDSHRNRLVHALMTRGFH